MNESDTDREPVLLPASHVAKMLQVSTRTLWRLLAAGKLIDPVKLGRSVRWRKDELMQWIAAGCPPRPQREKEGR
jgi:excisionase family DNA binding protein